MRLHHHQNLQLSLPASIAKKDKKINAQSAQIKNLRLKLDQAVAENSQIRELLSPATLTMAFSNTLTVTKTSFTGQTGNRSNNSAVHAKTFPWKVTTFQALRQEKMELPTVTKPAGIARILGTCWKTVSGLKPETSFLAET